jgi:hypothetical protein
MGIRGFIFEADGYFHARFATLMREAGFAVELDERTGAARVAAVPENIRSLFSPRRVEGEAAARALSASSSEVWEDLSPTQQRDRIDAEVRYGKRHKLEDTDGLPDFSGWREQTERAGWKVPDSFQFIGPPERALTREERHHKAYEVGLPWLAERFAHSAVVPHWDLRMAALRGLVHTGTEGLRDIGGVTKIMREEGVRQYGRMTPLIWGQEDEKRYTSVTTGLHESDEKEFVRLLQAAARDRSGAIQPGLLRRELDASGLDFKSVHGRAQRQAIERVGTGGRFGIIVAAAGAGKTTSLKPIVAARKEMGNDLHGASLAWRQTDDLIDAGIPQRNLKAFSVLMKALEAEQDMTAMRLTEAQKDKLVGGRHRRTILTENSVVAIDEFGLLGTRQGLELLRHRERLGFSIVALGDDKQVASIEAGAIIALSRRALGAENVPEIQTTIRQQGDREKKIVGLFREGRAAEALDMKRADGTAEMAYGGRDGVILRVAALYAERLVATKNAPTISAPTNADAHQISEAVRLERRKLNLLGPDLITVKATDGERDWSLRLARGDHVRLFKSTRADFGKRADGRRWEGSIGRNGSVLEVVGVNHAGLTLKEMPKDGKQKGGRVGTVAWSELRADQKQRWKPGEQVPARNTRVLLAYGDATTIHTAQGSTRDEHIVALPSGSGEVSGGQAYSANTRHAKASYLVTSEAAERIAVRESRPINDAHDITVDDKWANVAKAFSHQAKQDSALAMLDRVLEVKRGAVRAFHAAMRPADPARPAGPVQAPEIVQRRRWDISASIARAAGLVHDRGIGLSR